MGRLIIDGLTVLEDRAQSSNISWNVSGPLYVGGVPPGRAQNNIQVWHKRTLGAAVKANGVKYMWESFSVSYDIIRNPWKRMKSLSKECGTG